MAAQGRGGDLVNQVAAEYAAKGYAVVVAPNAAMLPGSLSSFEVDLIATRGEENLVIEVKHRNDLADGSLEPLVDAANQVGWRVELVVRPSDEPLTDSGLSERRLADAELLASQGQLEAALLLAWSGFEGVLHSLSTRYNIEGRTVGTRLLSELYTLGVLSGRQFESAKRTSAQRASVAHGQAGRSISYGEIEMIVNLARRLGATEFVPVGEMVDWFNENYEDPAHHVSYDTSEGGYQYVFGGPYNADDVLRDQFPSAADEDIDEAVSIIEQDGNEWVRKGQY